MTGALVELRPHELRHAGDVACARLLVAVSQGRASRFGDRYTSDVTGALSELAIAKSLGVYWEPDIGGNDHGCGDVHGYEVRGTAMRDPQLRVRPDDDDERPIVLVVTSDVPRLLIAGWVYGYEAKLARWLSGRFGNKSDYFVPAGELHPWAERPFSFDPARRP